MYIVHVLHVYIVHVLYMPHHLNIGGDDILASVLFKIKENVI